MKKYAFLFFTFVLLLVTACTHPIAGIYGKWVIDPNETPDESSDDIIFEFINNGTLKMYPRDASTEGSYDVLFKIVDVDTIAIIQTGAATTQFDVQITRDWVKNTDSNRTSLVETLTLSNDELGIEPYVLERLK